MRLQSRILIVDDHAANVEILKKLFGDSYELATAESGAKALVEADHFRPDIILLDVMMPGMDGYETCRRLRATPDLANSKILMVSAKTRLEERLEGDEAGADDYIIRDVTKLNYPNQHDNTLCSLYRRYPPWN